MIIELFPAILLNMFFAIPSFVAREIVQYLWPRCPWWKKNQGEDCCLPASRGQHIFQDNQDGRSEKQRRDWAGFDRRFGKGSCKFLRRLSSDYNHFWCSWWDPHLYKLYQVKKASLSSLAGLLIVALDHNLSELVSFLYLTTMRKWSNLSIRINANIRRVIL